MFKRARISFGKELKYFPTFTWEYVGREQAGGLNKHEERLYYQGEFRSYKSSLALRFILTASRAFLTVTGQSE